MMIEDITPTIGSAQPGVYVWPVEKKTNLHDVLPESAFIDHMAPTLILKGVSYDARGWPVFPEDPTKFEIEFMDSRGKRYKAKWEEVK